MIIEAEDSDLNRQDATYIKRGFAKMKIRMTTQPSGNYTFRILGTYVKVEGLDADNCTY
jgi:hypothetical protein